MKKWLIASSLIALLSACAYAPIYNGKETYSGSPLMLFESPRHTLDFFVEGLTKDLISSNVSVSSLTPLAMTSFVELQPLDQTNWLGNFLSEGLMHQFQRRGFQVIDFKSIGAIKVLPEGDFILSRDWKQLAQNQNIEYILVGTMLRQEGGVLINTRILSIETRIVVASAQGFLPADRIGRNLETQNTIRMENGSMLRTDPNLRQEYNIILRP